MLKATAYSLLILSSCALYGMENGGGPASDIAAHAVPIHLAITLSPTKRALVVGALVIPAILGPVLIKVNPFSNNEFARMGLNLAKVSVCIGGSVTLLKLANRF
jgi:hypothetical protein